MSLNYDYTIGSIGTLTRHSWIHNTVCWNRWIKFSCNYNTVYISCPWYTHVTPIL